MPLGRQLVFVLPTTEKYDVDIVVVVVVDSHI